ncbi:MAG: UDP-N-acetylmuramoyl-L-alanine--D-glutamate ligase, partial [Patescibacteria group bacterium]
TVSLLGKIFKATWPDSLVAGNIRDTVLFEALKKIKPASRLVLELSSWQLEIMDKHKQKLPLAVVTNILPDHLNRYNSLADYARAKAAIVRWQNKNNQAVLNYDNPRTRALAKQTKAKVYWFSLRRPVKRGCYLSAGWVYWRDKKINRLFKVEEIKLKGQHNLANVLAAAVVANLMGVSNKILLKVLKSYTGLHDRLELVRNFGGKKFYNDTAATAPVATVAALQTFLGQPVVLIAGGQDKNLPYQELAKQIVKSQAILITLPGTATDKLVDNLPKNYPYLAASQMKQAVTLANRSLLGSGIVLLSPGAASFGLFKHEFDRGEQFKVAVKELI